GLVEPAYEQARMLAQHLAGKPAAYQGSVVATNLKVSGVSVFSAGDFIGADGSEAILLSDVRRGTYKKLVITDGRLTGAVLIGDRSDALDHVAHRLQHIVARDGADAVAFYLSGQMLTEDYYVANKLMKGFLGSANVDTNSRLCMASTVAGHRRAFGADTVPGCYEDLDEADLLILVGSNAAWCHPVLFQRMLANKQKRGARMVVIDPRRTDTAGDADLFLGLKPGTDTALFAGLLVHLAECSALDH